MDRDYRRCGWDELPCFEGLDGLEMLHPLAMTNIAMENHHFNWEKLTISMAIFHSYVTVITRGYCGSQLWPKISKFSRSIIFKSSIFISLCTAYF